MRIDTAQAIGPTVPGSSTGTTSQVAQVPQPVAGAGDPEVQAIHAAVHGPFPSKTKHYEAILDANALNPPDRKWSDRGMEQAAGIASSNARGIKARKAPDTPNTAEVRSFLQSTLPTDRDDTLVDRYRRALDENDARQDDQKWPDKSMRKAANISGYQAKQVLRARAPDTPRTTDVGAFLEANRRPDGTDSSHARYRLALDQNDVRPQGQKWPDNSMIKAAGIDRGNAWTIQQLRAPDSPLTAQVRNFMDNSAPAEGTDSGADRYRRALRHNDSLPEDRKWTDKSMWKAAGILPSNAKVLRDELPANWPPPPTASTGR